ncbi:MAG TPA: SagB/ThcOx family dehydrogenase [Candidatus Paceibacterota bacterium]
MTEPFSSFFHRQSKNTPRPEKPLPPEQWPASWKTVQYKSYSRFPSIPLPPYDPSIDLVRAVRARKSGRTFSEKAISLSTISTLLKYSAGIVAETDRGFSRRAYPSAGGRYPLETYLLLLRSGDLPAGLYHYQVKGHALAELWQRSWDGKEIDELFTYDWVKRAAAIVLFSAVFERTQMKYGERGYRLVLIEAGHAAQNMYLCSAGLGLSCCAISGVYDERVEALLDIDGETESLVYALALG